MDGPGHINPSAKDLTHTSDALGQYPSDINLLRRAESATSLDAAFGGRHNDVADAIRSLAALMEKQNNILIEINQRQAVGLSPVSHRGNGSWNPPLNSAPNLTSSTIEKQLLDTRLIFVGIFSAVISAIFSVFIVELLHALKPDKTARTNELLANLTEIIIEISGISPSSPMPPEPLIPLPNHIKLMYFSIALFLGICIATLAVVGWDFLDDATKLRDIYQRWIRIHPAFETMFGLLVFPIILFLISLLRVFCGPS